MVPATRVFAQGDAGDRFYLLVEGTARVHLDELELARLGPGSPVGEMALLDGEPRSAQVSSVTACRFLTLTRAQFFAAIAQAPEVARALLRTLSVRIRLLSRLVATTEGRQAQGPVAFLETAGASLWQRDAQTGRWHMPLPQATAEDYAGLTASETPSGQGADGFAEALCADAQALRQALRTRHADAREEERLPAAEYERLSSAVEALVLRLRSPLSPRRGHAVLVDGLYRALRNRALVCLRMVLASPTALAEIGDFLAVARLLREAGLHVEPHLLAVRWENLVEAREHPAAVRQAAYHACLRGLQSALGSAGFSDARITPLDIDATAGLERATAPADVLAAFRAVAAAAADVASADATLVRHLLWITGFYARQHSLSKLGAEQPLLDLGIRMAVGHRASQPATTGLALMLTSELNQRFVACYGAGLPVANIRLQDRTGVAS